MAWSDFGTFALVTLFYATSVKCIPKYEAGGGFMPSTTDFMSQTDKTRDQIAMASQIQERSDSSSKKREANESNDISDRNQEARFGFTNLGSTGTGYGGLSGYAPAKIDLGGILLGAVIGVGTILVIPKLLYVLSGTYGSYARSEEGGITQMMARLDDALARHGIDTTSCMQRAVCTFSKNAASAVQSAGEPEEEDKISSVDRIVNAVTTNQVFRTAMEGTAVQEAVEAGRAGQSCPHMYSHCSLSLESMLMLVSRIATSTSDIPSARPTAPSAAL